MNKNAFEQLLFEGALNAVRTLTLAELYQQLEYLAEMDLPDDISAFPASVLAIVIKEKIAQSILN